MNPPADPAGAGALGGGRGGHSYVKPPPSDPGDGGRLFADRGARRGPGELRAPPAIVGYPGVSPAAAWVWVLLRNLPSGRDRGVAWPGHSWLARRLNVGRRSIARYLLELHAAGWLTIEPLAGLSSNLRLHDEPVARPPGGPPAGSAGAPDASNPPSGTHAKLAWVPMPNWHGGSRQIGMTPMPNWHAMDDLVTTTKKVDEDSTPVVSAQGAPPRQPPLPDLAGPVGVPLPRRRRTRADALWRLVLEDVRGAVSPTEFANWLGGSRGVELDGDRLRVAVPSSFAADWLNTRFRPLLEAALARAHGRALALEVLVQGYEG